MGFLLHEHVLPWLRRTVPPHSDEESALLLPKPAVVAESRGRVEVHRAHASAELLTVARSVYSQTRGDGRGTFRGFEKEYTGRCWRMVEITEEVLARCSQYFLVSLTNVAFFFSCASPLLSMCSSFVSASSSSSSSGSS